MADLTLLNQFLRELDMKYINDGGWGSLDYDHPDIKKAQALNPLYDGKNNNGGRKKIWTPEKDEFIKQNFLKMSDKELSKHLGVAVSTLKNRRRELKCVQPNGYMGTSVECVDENGNVIVQYMTVTKAVRGSGMSEYAIRKSMNTGEAVNGVYWRKTKERITE